MMKAYVKPTLKFVMLTAEERFAVTSCTTRGDCVNDIRYA